MVRLLLALLTAGSLGGCHVSIEALGTEPLIDHFYFPAGIALDRGQQYLYVTNGNADLRFGAGTIQIIDVKQFNCAIAKLLPCFGASCARPVDCSAYKPALDAAACQRDALNPMLINCSEATFMRWQSTLKVGNFAGNLEVEDLGGDRRRLFVGVRGDPSITVVDVDLSADGTTRRLLGCFDNPNTPVNPPGATIPPCDTSHLIQLYTCLGKPNCVVTDIPTTIPPEPFGLFLDQGLDQGSPYANLLVSHLSAGQVMLVNVTAQPLIRDVSTPFFVADATGHHGAFALAPLHPGDPGSLWYLTSNLQATVANFQISDQEVVVPSTTFSVASAFSAGNDVRDIQIEPGAKRAFLTENNPPSVIVLDTRILPDSITPGVPVNQVVDVINICYSPSHLAIRQELVPGSPDRVASRLWVPCFTSNQVMVVDPDAPDVLATILVGRGPNQIVFSDPSAGPARAYVNNYSESTISVIDLEPGSPFENRVIANIGIPVPPPAP